MAETIEPVLLRVETEERYLNYAMSVITSRALPGRARRPEAGAAAHPVHDVSRPAPDLRWPAA